MSRKAHRMPDSDCGAARAADDIVCIGGPHVEGYCVANDFGQAQGPRLSGHRENHRSKPLRHIAKVTANKNRVSIDPREHHGDRQRLHGRGGGRQEPDSLRHQRDRRQWR